MQRNTGAGSEKKIEIDVGGQLFKVQNGLVALEIFLKVRIDQSGILINLIDLLSLIDCFLIIMLPSLQALMYIRPMQTMKTESVEEDSTESLRYQVGG